MTWRCDFACDIACGPCSQDVDQATDTLQWLPWSSLASCPPCRGSPYKKQVVTRDGVLLHPFFAETLMRSATGRLLQDHFSKLAYDRGGGGRNRDATRMPMRGHSKGRRHDGPRGWGERREWERRRGWGEKQGWGEGRSTGGGGRGSGARRPPFKQPGGEFS